MKLVNLIPSPCTFMGPRKTVWCSLGPFLHEPTPLWVLGFGEQPRSPVSPPHPVRSGIPGSDLSVPWEHLEGEHKLRAFSQGLFCWAQPQGCNKWQRKTPYFDISVLMLFATVTMDSNALPDFPAQSPNLRIFQWSETNAQHKNSLAFLQGNMELRPNPEVTFYRPNFQKRRWKWRHQTSAWGCFHVWKAFFLLEKQSNLHNPGKVILALASSVLCCNFLQDISGNFKHAPPPRISLALEPLLSLALGGKEI